MSQVKVSAFMKGARELARAARQAPKTAQERVREQVAIGTRLVEGTARQRVVKRTGELASTIRSEFSRDGMTGYVKAGYGKLVRAGAGKSARRTLRRKLRVSRALIAGSQGPLSPKAIRALTLGVYAPIIEYGDKKRKRLPKPFLGPALETHRRDIVDRIAKALGRATTEASL